MNNYCKCGGRIAASTRMECCATKQQWMEFTCNRCERKFKQKLRMAKGVVQDGEEGRNGYYHYAPYSVIRFGSSK